MNCLFADFDAKVYDGGKEEALYSLRTVTPPASVIVDSGGGYHGYWLFDSTLLLQDADTLEYARRLQWRWVKYVGGDQGAKDLCRVLRVPGSTNYKPEYAPDFPEVRFERWLNVRYSLQELIAVLPLDKPRKQKRFTVDARNGDAGEKVLEIAARMIDRSTDGAKHYELLKASRLVGGAIAAGMLDENDALNVLEGAIRAKANVSSIDAAFATIGAGIRYGKEFPLRSE